MSGSGRQQTQLRLQRSAGPSRLNADTSHRHPLLGQPPLRVRRLPPAAARRRRHTTFTSLPGAVDPANERQRARGVSPAVGARGMGGAGAAGGAGRGGAGLQEVSCRPAACTCTAAAIKSKGHRSRTQHRIGAVLAGMWSARSGRSRSGAWTCPSRGSPCWRLTFAVRGGGGRTKASLASAAPATGASVAWPPNSSCGCLSHICRRSAHANRMPLVARP